MARLVKLAATSAIAATAILLSTVKSVAQISPGKTVNLGNCVVMGGINNAQIIQSCPTIYQAPDPTFKILKEYPTTENVDGTFRRSALVEVDAPYVPGNLLIVVSGTTVLNLEATSQNMLESGSGKLNNGSFWFMFGRPWGQYTIIVTTSDQKTPSNIQLQFNHKNPVTP
jgi:hypothetical protein